MGCAMGVAQVFVRENQNHTTANRCRARVVLDVDQARRIWLLQYTPILSGRISCRMVVEISSIDLVVVDNQRMPSRRIMASASATSWRQFSSDA